MTEQELIKEMQRFYVERSEMNIKDTMQLLIGLLTTCIVVTDGLDEDKVCECLIYNVKKARKRFDGNE